MRWWGWGEDGAGPALPGHALEHLRATVGTAAHPRPPVSLGEVRLAPPELDAGVRARLAAIVGADAVQDDHEARVLHAAGKAYPDLVRLRSGAAPAAPDAVVAPGHHDEVRAVLELCSAEGVAVVPFGGGTSVVGGLDVVRTGAAGVVSLDLRRMAAVLAVDERSLTARVQAGLTGPALEEALAPHGLTIGHFPQSYEYATVGGWVAARSAGQASTGYGRIDELVLGLRLAAPAGDLDLSARPASAAGPDLRQLVLGSEGTLGVVTEVTLQAHRRPVQTRDEAYGFGSFAQGAEALRALEQAGAAPAIARLSDEDETSLQLLLAGGAGAKARATRAYLRLRGIRCVAICGWEGTEDSVRARRRRGRALLKAAGAVSLGERPGRAWRRERYRAPYLRDTLLTHGVMVETLETAALWSDLHALHGAVGAALRGALQARGTPPLVMCHVSHLYPSGASLYFTFLARQQEGEEVAQWQAAKSAASEAIVQAGATITHHHGVGTHHAAWMRDEIGPLGLDALRAVKATLDPAGIMNPGKLLF